MSVARRTPQPDGRETERGHEQRRAGAEECAGSIERAGGARRQQRRRRAIGEARSPPYSGDVAHLDRRCVAAAPDPTCRTCRVCQFAREQAALRDRASPRSVHQMQTIAAASAPAAPATSDAGDTCRVSAVVADRADPPGAQPVHHQRRRRRPRRRRRSTLPTTASTNPSVANSRRTRAVENPTARSRPTSRARCSTRA